MEEYKDKINQYCSLLEEEKPQKKKKKRKTEEKKIEEKAPTIKLVDVKSMQKQIIQQQKSSKSTDKSSRPDDSVFNTNESKVNKFKEMFDNENEIQSSTKQILKERDNQKAKKAKSDIFSKIQALE